MRNAGRAGRGPGQHPRQRSTHCAARAPHARARGRRRGFRRARSAPRLQARVPAACRLVQDARRLQQPPRAQGRIGGRGGGLGRQPRRGRGLRGDEARHARHDLRTRGGLAREDGADPRLRRAARGGRSALCRRTGRERAVRRRIGRRADPRLRPGGHTRGTGDRRARIRGRRRRAWTRFWSQWAAAGSSAECCRGIRDACR